MARILAPFLALLMVTSCSTTSGLPPLAKTVGGEINFGGGQQPWESNWHEHVMIYGDYDNRFIWGIIFPRDDMKSINYTEVPEPRNVLELRSGITLAFVKDDVTVTKGTKKLRMRLKPYTIYLMNDDLSFQSSDDLTGIKVVSKPAYDWRTGLHSTYSECILPDDLYLRFGKNSF